MYGTRGLENENSWLFKSNADDYFFKITATDILHRALHISIAWSLIKAVYINMYVYTVAPRFKFIDTVYKS